LNPRPQIPLDRRPDIIDLAGPDYDAPPGERANKTLIIASAPRTGSYELCRFALAAGLGVPFEYMHPQFASQFGLRWGLPPDPLQGPHVGGYIESLRRRRAQNGVFAVNLQYWHFTGFLMNNPGNALFSDAFVVCLFRPDILAQVISWRVAMATGIWDYSGRRTADPRPYPNDPSERAAQFQEDVKFIVGEDAGFRELFALGGFKPYYLAMDELFRAPREVIARIADALGVSVNEPALTQMIARSKPYPRDNAAYARAIEGLGDLPRRAGFALR